MSRRNPSQVPLEETVHQLTIEEIITNLRALVAVDNQVPVISVVGPSEEDLALPLPPPSSNSTMNLPVDFGNWVVNIECILVLDRFGYTKEAMLISA